MTWYLVYQALAVELLGCSDYQQVVAGTVGCVGYLVYLKANQEAETGLYLAHHALSMSQYVPPLVSVTIKMVFSCYYLCL